MKRLKMTSSYSITATHEVTDISEEKLEEYKATMIKLFKQGLKRSALKGYAVRGIICDYDDYRQYSHCVYYTVIASFPELVSMDDDHLGKRYKTMFCFKFDDFQDVDEADIDYVVERINEVYDQCPPMPRERYCQFSSDDVDAAMSIASKCMADMQAKYKIKFDYEVQPDYDNYRVQLRSGWWPRQGLVPDSDCQTEIEGYVLHGGQLDYSSEVPNVEIPSHITYALEDTGTWNVLQSDAENRKEFEDAFSDAISTFNKFLNDVDRYVAEIKSAKKDLKEFESKYQSKIPGLSITNLRCDFSDKEYWYWSANFDIEAYAGQFNKSIKLLLEDCGIPGHIEKKLKNLLKRNKPKKTIKHYDDAIYDYGEYYYFDYDNSLEIPPFLEHFGLTHVGWLIAEDEYRDALSGYYETLEVVKDEDGNKIAVVYTEDAKGNPRFDYISVKEVANAAKGIPNSTYNYIE